VREAIGAIHPKLTLQTLKPRVGRRRGTRIGSGEGLRDIDGLKCNILIIRGKFGGKKENGKSATNDNTVSETGEQT